MENEKYVLSFFTYRSSTTVLKVIIRSDGSGFHPGVLGAPRGAYLIPWIIIRRMI